MKQPFPDKVFDAFEEAAGFDLRGRIVLATFVGSKSHNTYVPPGEGDDSIDDIDITAICVPPPHKVYGLEPWKETEQIQLDEWDVVVHSITKATKLMLKGNPNMLALLWSKPEHRLVVEHCMLDYFDQRLIFSTKQVVRAFRGYAGEQFRKMTSAQPYQGYMGAKRKRLVDRFGYDTKNAAHLIRLLNMCRQYMLEGKLYVWREEPEVGGDAERIRAIKRGEFTLGEVQDMAKMKMGFIDTGMDACTLPDEPDSVLAEEMLMRAVKEMWIEY